MKKKELKEIIKKDKKAIIENKNDIKFVENIIKSRAKNFENIEEIFKYMDSTLEGAYSLLIPEYYRCLVLQLPSKIIQENFHELIERILEFKEPNSEERNQEVCYSIENIISNLQPEVQLSNYEYLINLLTGNLKEGDVSEITKLRRALLIGNLPVNGVNSENYKQVFDNLDSIYDDDTALVISRVERNIIMSLPTEIKVQEYEDFVNRMKLSGDLTVYDFGNFIAELPKEALESHYDSIINQIFSYDSSEIFRNEVFIKFATKLLTKTEDEEIDNEKIKKIWKDVTQKAEEKIEHSFEREKFYEKIVTALPNSFVEENIDLCLSAFNKEIPENVSLYILDNLRGETILKLQNELNVSFSAENIEHYQRCFEYLLETQNNALIENNMATQIFNFVNSTSDTRVDNFKAIIEQERKKYESPNMKLYTQNIPEDYSKDFEPMNEKLFKKFSKDLEKIKILEGRIPEKYCDYIISQKLNPNSPISQNIEEYMPILKRVFEDKANYVLKQNGITGYTIEFFEDDGSGTQGYQNRSEKKIGFLEENLKNLNMSNTHIINTMFHEIRHAIQSKNYGTSDFRIINGSQYNMLKESCIKTRDLIFYQRNYTRMYCEIDARLAGARGQAEYLLYLGVPVNTIIEDNEKDGVLLKDCYERSKEEESKNEEYAVNKVDESGNIISISEKVCEILKESPDLLKKYPVLTLEFAENGERKSTVEILKNAIDVANSDMNDSLVEIYSKIFEGNINVGLDSTVECLEYISNILHDYDYSDSKSGTIIDFVNLIIKNETFNSLANSNFTDEKFIKAKEVLKQIVSDNPNLEISKLIEEKLDGFAKTGSIEAENKIDSSLKENAIVHIMMREVESMEEFNRIIEDVKKLSNGSNEYEYSIRYGFKCLFKNQFEKNSELDTMLMLDQAIIMLSETSGYDVIKSFIENMPADMQARELPSIINDVFKKYNFIEYDSNRIPEARLLSKLIKPEVLEKNPNFIKQTFENVIEPAEIVFLQQPETVEEFKKVIEEAKNKGASPEQITSGMKGIVTEGAEGGKTSSIEMLYNQIEELREYDRKSCVNTFFVYASNELKEQNVEKILRHILIEKEFFGQDDVEEIFEYATKHLKPKAFENDPELMKRLESIKSEAIEKKIEQEKKEFEKLPDIIKSGIVAGRIDNYDASKIVIEKVKKQMQFSEESTVFSIISKVLKLKELNDWNKENIIEGFIKIMPADMQARELPSIINDVFKKYNLIKYASSSIPTARSLRKLIKPEVLEQNPNFINQTFENAIEPAEIVFLQQPETAEEFKKVIEEAKNKGASPLQITIGMKEIVKEAAKDGKTSSIEMLYNQIEESTRYSKKMCVNEFFIYASNELKEQNVEKILRHILIEKDFFGPNNVEAIFKDATKYLRPEAFEKDPELMKRLEKIKLEAIKKKERRLKNNYFEETQREEDNLKKLQKENEQEEAQREEDDLWEFQEENDLEETQIEEDDLKELQEENDLEETQIEEDDLQALKEIRNTVLPQEINQGEKSIKFFLDKMLKKFKDGVGNIFKGGDNGYGDR